MSTGPTGDGKEMPAHPEDRYLAFDSTTERGPYPCLPEVPPIGEIRDVHPIEDTRQVFVRIVVGSSG